MSFSPAPGSPLASTSLNVGSNAWGPDVLVADMESMSMLDTASLGSALGSQPFIGVPSRLGVDSGGNFAAGSSRHPPQHTYNLIRSFDPLLSSHGSVFSEGLVWAGQEDTEHLTGTGSLDMTMRARSTPGHWLASSPRLSTHVLVPREHRVHIVSQFSQPSRYVGPETVNSSLHSDVDDFRQGSPRQQQQRDKQTYQKGQGYRKLWQQVTKVGRGQRLGDNLPLSDEITVEDLVRMVIKLPAQESVTPVVEQGLQLLDSSAVAALLKELSKQGHIRRAVEIFDWLRALQPDHELHRLCDLYTYTTMISQCGSHQQLRRALELVAEMRGRGITCNVHTYSALMNVCIKANELELAQDVFKQMVDEGCAPNLVTYNILIDVHVKNGNWEEALALLGTLENQGIQAEARTYNTIISACNKGGQPERALQVYDRMLSAGVKPSATTFTALISAYGKRGMVEKAMEIFQDMSWRGCERNVITYSSLISACEKAGRWELALDLLAHMKQEGCKPNVVTYNSLIAACAHHGGPWEKAAELFDQMQTEGLKPDSITYTALLGAFEKAGQWVRALRTFEGMLQMGCQPDAPIYNILLEALWQSGIILAQARAMQLWTQANRNGQFRIYINSRSAADALQYSAPAFTPGAICVTALRWLSELRSRLIKEGPAVFRSRVSLSLQRSRQSQQQNSAGSSAISLPSSRMGSQQFSLGSSAIDNMQPGGGGIVHVSMPGISSSAYEALSALLAGSSSPFKVQMLEGALIIEAPSQALIQWLNSQEAAELLFLAQSNFLKKMNQEVLIREDASVAGRCCEAYGAVRRVEDGHMLDISKYNSSVLQQRSQVVSMALKYTSAFGFSQDTMYDGLQLFDKAICNSSGLNPALWPLVLCSCTLLAAKSNALERNNQHWPSAHHISMTSGFSIEAISTMEQNVLAALQQDLSCISVLRVVQLCLERLGYYMQGEDGAIKLSGCTAATMYSLLAKVACSPLVLGIRPSLVAAATVVVMRRVQGSVPHWPTALQLMTSYTLSTNSDLQMVVMHVESLLLSQT